MDELSEALWELIDEGIIVLGVDENGEIVFMSTEDER